MSSVDDRIVNMKFNSSEFTQGVTHSQKSLTDLEKTLANTAKGKGLTTMAADADKVKNKFSAMKMAGIAALVAIAAKAVIVGLKVVKGFTLDPIKQGWDEYNTNLKAIQTVIANTGKSMPEVNKGLKLLNEYSDQTIYNFSEMAKNVGTFTAAGVKLDTSISAIKGISNMAALSGSTSEQASRAMYQLSQAIAAGRVSLQDWNSVVNAGMGGKNLQTALIQTGQAMGAIDKGAVKFGDTIKISGESFRESISAVGGASWLTSDILVKTLALMDGRLSKTAITANLMATGQHNTSEATKLANDELEKQQEILKKQGYNKEQIASLIKMANSAYESATVVKTLPQLIGVVKESLGSVWANFFSAVVGNFNQSKKLWTAVSNSIGDQIKGFSGSLTNVIVAWKRDDGRNAVIEGFKSGFEALGKILGTVKMAFRDVFPPTAGKVLANLSRGFQQFTEALVPSKDTLKSLRSIFGGVFAIIHIGLTIVTGISKAFGAFFGALFTGSSDARGGILSMMGSVGEILIAFDKWLSSGGTLIKIFETIGATAGAVLHPILAVIGFVIKTFAALVSVLSGQGISGFVDLFADAKKTFSEFGSTISNVLDKVIPKLGGLSGVFDKVENAFNALKPTFNNIGAFISSALSSAFSNIPGADMAMSVIMGIADGFGGSAIEFIKKAAIALANAIPEAIKNVLGIASPAEALVSVGAAIVDGIIKGITSGIHKLPEIASSLGDRIKESLQGMDLSDAVGSLVEAIGPKLLSAVSKIPVVGIALSIVTGIAEAFGSSGTELLKKAAIALANMIPESIKSTLGISSPAKELISVGTAVVQGIIEGILIGIRAIPDIASAIGGAIKQLFAQVDFGEGTDRIKTVFGEIGSGIMAAFTVLGNAASWVKDQFAGLTDGMNMLDFVSTVNALLTGGLIVSLMKTTAVLEKLDFKGLVKNTFGELQNTLKSMQQAVKAKMLMQIAIAVGVLVASIVVLSFIDPAKIAMSIGAIGLLLGMLVGSLAALSKISKGDVNMASLAGSITLISLAMLLLATAIKVLGSMNLRDLAEGVGAMALSMAIMIGAILAFSKVGPLAQGAAGAILVMSIAMNVLAGAIAILGNMDFETLKTGLGAMAIALALLVLSLAMLTSLGPGVAASAGGVITMAAAMVILAGAVALFGNMDIETLKQGFVAIAIGLALMVAALVVLGANIGGTVVAAGAMMAMALALNILVPVIMALGSMDYEKLKQGLIGLAIAMGILVVSLLLLGAIGTGLGPGLIMLGAALALAGVGMLAFGTGFALMATAGVAGVAVLTVAFQAFMMLLPALGIQMAAAVTNFLETISKAMPRIRAAFDNIMKHVFGIIDDAIPRFEKTFDKFVAAGIRSFEKNMPKWNEAGWKVIDEFLKSMDKHIPSITKSGMQLMTKFMKAIEDNNKPLMDQAGETIISLVENLSTTIDEKAERLRAAGKKLAISIIDGLTGGLLSDGIQEIKDAADAIAQAIPERIRKWLGIDSPSKAAIYWGKMIGAGLAKGIYSSMKNAVGATVAMANAVLAAGNKVVGKAQKAARLQQASATRALTRADIAQSQATKAQTKATKDQKAADRAETHHSNMADKTAAQRAKKRAAWRAFKRKEDKAEISQRKANRSQRGADAGQRSAEANQRKADAAALAVTKAKEFAAADTGGKGDIKTANAQAQADEAARLLARASAEASEAIRLRDKDAKASRALLARARADAKAAKRLATAAQASQKAALAFYAQEVNDRIAQIIADNKAEKKAKEDQAEYDAADAQGKADILNARAELNEKKAKTAAAKAADLIERARRLARTDAVAAMALLDRSEAQAQIAREAAEQAAEEREQATQDLGSTTSPDDVLTPSRNILEDAARSVDRYTTALAEATQAAAAQQQVVQFVQNNTSPVALTASEIYRQTNNLLSTQEVKMGAN